MTAGQHVSAWLANLVGNITVQKAGWAFPSGWMTESQQHSFRREQQQLQPVGMLLLLYIDKSGHCKNSHGGTHVRYVVCWWTQAQRVGWYKLSGHWSLTGHNWATEEDGCWLCKDAQHTNLAELDAILKGVNMALIWESTVLYIFTVSVKSKNIFGMNLGMFGFEEIEYWPAPPQNY